MKNVTLSAGVCGALLWSAAAHAALFTVNTVMDAPDAQPGDGVCETKPGNGVCTLRAAIEETDARAGPDAVLVPAGAYVLRWGELDVTDDLTLTGAGGQPKGTKRTRIDAYFYGRAFAIAASANVSLAEVQIVNGLGRPGQNGGGIYNQGALTLNDVTLSHNRSGTGAGGGGLYNDGGTATLTNVTATNNYSKGGGGGIYNNNGQLTLVAVTLTLNHATVGAGLYNAGTADVTNSTIIYNVATVHGGGLYNSGTANLTNVTLSCNHCDVGGGCFLNDGGVRNDGTVNVLNTLVADNWVGNCSGNPLTSLGHNFDSATSCGLSAATDLTNRHPRFSPLRANGGFTKTQALRLGSPAIDAGDDSVTGPPDNLTTDQRGLPRLSGAHVDIGAYEVQQ